MSLKLCFRIYHILSSRRQVYKKMKAILQQGLAFFDLLKQEPLLDKENSNFFLPIFTPLPIPTLIFTTRNTRITFETKLCISILLTNYFTTPSLLIPKLLSFFSSSLLSCFILSTSTSIFMITLQSFLISTFS